MSCVMVINWLGRTDKKLSDCERALPFNQSFSHYINQMKHHSVNDVTLSLYPYSFDLFRCVVETLWREVYVVHHWLIPGQLVKDQGQLPHVYCGAAIGGPWGTLHHRVCHMYHEPSMAELGMVCRVEKVGFWKIDFRHCVYFMSVR